MYRLYGSRNTYIDVVYLVKVTDTEDKVYSRRISSLSSAPPNFDEMFDVKQLE